MSTVLYLYYCERLEESDQESSNSLDSFESDEELMNYYLYDNSDGYAYDDEGYQDECYDCLDL